ncbi:hypothetical protein PSPO01_15644 [Paraphaeosphaeria sporulosa]
MSQEKDQGIALAYGLFVGASRRMTLKKRFNQVEDERDQLQDLFDLLCTSPAAEAEELFRRLRTSRDPSSVLQMVRQAHLLLSEPDPTARAVSIPEVETLDKDALRRSAFKLRAHPWTTAAGDGIVSSLISSFFAWDGSYLVSSIDQETFIRAMGKGDIADATFCSPSLVNAITYLTGELATRASWPLCQDPINY